MQFYKTISKETGMAVKTLGAFQAQGMPGLLARAKAQEQLNMTMAQENALLNDTLILSRPLIAAEKQQLIAEQQANSMKVQGNRAKLAAINTTLLLGQADEELNATLLQERT